MLSLKELKPLVTSKHWPLLVEYLEDLERQQVNALVTSKQTEEIYKIQGKIQQIRAIKSLETTISSL